MSKQYEVKEIIDLFDVLFENDVISEIDFIKVFKALNDKLMLKEHKVCKDCGFPMIEIDVNLKTNKNKMYKCHNCNYFSLLN